MIKQLRNRYRKAKCHAVFADFYGTEQALKMHRRIARVTRRKLGQLGVRT